MIELLAAGSFMDMLKSPLALLPLFLIVFYFMAIRPQQKQQRELQQWLDQLKKGDEVITTSGFWGKVMSAETGNPYVILELQEKVRVRVLRSHLAGKAPEPKTPASPAPASQDEKK